MATRLAILWRANFLKNGSRLSSTAAAAAGKESAKHDHTASKKLWKRLSIFVAIPAVILCKINADIKEAEHHEHWERPEFVPYEHLYRRTKAFPWGDGNHTLFHNKQMNALPEGYEDE